MMNKRRGSQSVNSLYLESIYSLANMIVTNMKEVNVRLLKIRSQKRKIEKWDNLMFKLESLETKQNECLQILQEDLQLINQVRIVENTDFYK